VIALVGLLGILLGEQLVPLVKRAMGPEPVNAAWVSSQCGEHVLGELPKAQGEQPCPPAQKEGQP